MIFNEIRENLNIFFRNCFFVVCLLRRDSQCDQIWRNFPHFGKILKVFGHFSVALVVISQTFVLTLANFMLLWKFSLL